MDHTIHSTFLPRADAESPVAFHRAVRDPAGNLVRITEGAR